MAAYTGSSALLLNTLFAYMDVHDDTARETGLGSVLIAKSENHNETRSD